MVKNMADQSLLPQFFDKKKDKDFKVQFIRKKIRTKQYIGKNNKTYRNTLYELLGIKIINPRIYYDKKNDDHYVIWYPKHEELLKAIKMAATLKDGWTEDFFKQIILTSIIYFFMKGYSKEEVKKIIKEVMNSVYFISMGEKDGREETNL